MKVPCNIFFFCTKEAPLFMKPWKATKPNREALSLTYISVPERQSQKCKGHTQKHRTHTPEPPGLGADLTPRAPGRWEGQRATGAYPRGLLLTPSFCLWAAPGLMPTLLAGSAFREWTSPAHLLLWQLNHRGSDCFSSYLAWLPDFPKGPHVPHL